MGKMKRKIGFFMGVTCLSVLALAPVGEMAELQRVQEGVYWAPKETPTRKGRSLTTTVTDERSLPATRAALSAEDEQIVQQIEKELKQEMNAQKARSLTSAVFDKALVNIAFDFGFARDSTLAKLVFGAGSAIDEQDEFVQWFRGLGNVSRRQMNVQDQTLNQSIYVQADYIDNQSSRTVVMHHGYRSNSFAMLGQAKLFSDLGYNVLLPMARSHGESEGQYITYGRFENEDLNGWIQQELVAKPNQKITVMGVSMGAATVMMSQKVPQANVEAIIEDCGYSSLRQQLTATVSLLTQYFKYIPVVNWTDWEQKQQQWIDQLNETKVKPLLKFDIDEVSPLESIQVSGLPTLFIHGLADGFIPFQEKERLAARAIGYKAEYDVPGAGHAQAFSVNQAAYKQKIVDFLAVVEGMQTKHPVVAEDRNLLANTEFVSDYTTLQGWQTSLAFASGSFHTEPLVRNQKSEFVLRKQGKEETMLLFPYEGGIRFFSKYLQQPGFIGQDVELLQGENYELQFEAKNDTNAWFTSPKMVYGFGDERQEISLKDGTARTYQQAFKAAQDGTVKVKVGMEMAKDNWLDSRRYANVHVKNVRLRNTDQTPPQPIQFDEVRWTNQGLSLQVRGEANTTVILETSEGQERQRHQLNASGKAQFLLERNGNEQIVHLRNMDKKGNLSQSIVFIIE